MDLPIPYGHQYISDEDIKAVSEVLRSYYITQGPACEKFEKEFAEYVDVPYAGAACNATASLHCAAMAIGVHSGDNVIVAPLTFASSASCIRMCGGNVTFCDIDPKTYIMDINKVRDKLETVPKGTYKGIVVVDFAGNVANMEEWRKLADEYGLWIIEDACHAPGGYFIDSKGQKQLCGSSRYSGITVFSFHPVKHITAGEGGMVCTRNKALADHMISLHNHGTTRDPNKLTKVDGGWYYEVQELGWNYRITDFQAALGASQLHRNDQGVKRRRQIADRYNEAFASCPDIITPYVEPNVFHAYHLYVIQVPDRKGLYDYLKEQQILAQIHYYPLHLMPYYLSLGNKKGDLPVVEEYYEHCISLPMFPTLTEKQQEYVIEHVLKFVNKK